MFRKDLVVKLTFILRPKASHANILENSIPGRVNNKYKDPEIEIGLSCLKIQRYPVCLIEMERHIKARSCMTLGCILHSGK